MTRRKSIKVIVGSWGPHVMNGLWSHLMETMDVELLVLQGSDTPKMDTNLPLVLFPEVSDMQGYYRDLEQYIQGADLVFTYETSKLASFQALRCAKSFNIPCVVISNEYSATAYERFANIKAIKFDIAQNADHFLTTSHRATRLLYSEQVDASRVTRLSTYMDHSADTYSEKLRDKFRRYIGLDGSHKLIVARGVFDRPETASAVFHAFRALLVSKRMEQPNDYRLLLLGQGASLQNLKYEASDLGIGRQTIFLDQDASAFWKDLVSAADLIVWDRSKASDSVETFPFALSQALCSGVSCIVPTGTIYDEVAGEAPVIRLGDLSSLDLAEAFEDVFDAKVSLKEQRLAALASVQRLFKSSVVVAAISAVIDSLTVATSGPSARDKVQLFLQQYQSPLLRSQAKDLGLKVEEYLLLNHLEASQSAELWRLKGDICCALNDTEAAITHYEKALQLDDKCFRAYRGLGYIAWTGHGHEEAMSFFKKALALEHNDYHSLVGVGLIYRRLRLLDESLFWLGRAVDLGGAESQSLSLIIQACLEQADAVSSLKALEQLRESFGDLPQIIRGLSQVYLAHGMSDKAGLLLDQASA